MDIITPTQIKEILKKYDAQPKKGFGQNFLINEGVLLKIIKAADLHKNDVIVEVGPGLGILTKELAAHVKQVIAIEKDYKMVKILREALKDIPNITIIQDDILKISSDKLPQNYKIVANLPYYISAHFIRRFLEVIERKPSSMTLLFQKEVAERITASPPRMHLLSVAVQAYAKANIVSLIHPDSFWPAPKVESALVHLSLYKRKLPKELFTVLKAGFLHPRRQLVNNLKEGLELKREEVEAWLNKHAISTTQRAERLTVENWIQLAKTFRMEE